MQRKLATNGNVFKRTDNRWGGVVWYQDEKEERKRKSFSGTTKQEVNQKITDYIKRYYKILKAAGIERKGLHSLRHTFATNLVNGQRQPDGSIHSLTPKQVADLLGHSTSQITEMYYVRKDTARLNGITDGFEI